MYLGTRRRPLDVAAPVLATVSDQWPRRNLPALVTVQAEGVDLPAWLAANRAEAEALVLRRGGLLLRGFDVRGAEDFRRAALAFSGALLEYKERSTPRSQVADYLYTSTEYPADQVIPLHNENSYSHTWPRHVWFFCETCAERGGETSIADSREVFRRLDPGLRERFGRRGVMSVRSYGPSLGLSWQETFQMQSPQEVERYCAEAGIECRWSEGRLTTRQARPAVARHPVTGEPLWFNQAHLFHASSLPPAVYRSLAAAFAESEFPRHAYYGDGQPLEDEALAHIREVYAGCQEEVRWQRGDVLLLDNMLTAHGRLPFAGPRRLLVAMARPCTTVD
jgi:alpha-ketoglutarate-dependent taurine dioxygenase